jgi:uncharacterized protein YjdB
MHIGDKMTLAVRGTCSCGDEFVTTFAWASSDNTIATVSPTGEVTALMPGVVTIAASSSGKSGEITIVVQAAGSMIGPAGGTVTSADGMAEVVIPAGALLAPADVVIEKADESGLGSDALFVDGSAYTLKPLTLQLNQPAQLRLRYNPALVPLGVFAEQLRVKARVQNAWQQTAQNGAQPHVVQGAIQNFGLFGITYEPAIGTMIGVNGGTVHSADGKLVLDIPPFALDAPADIVITKLADDVFIGDPLFVRGTAYELKPHGLHFALPALLTIQYGPSNVPCDLNKLRIQLRDEPQNQWLVSQMQRLRPDEHMVTAEISSFSVFALVGLASTAAPPARMEVNPEAVELEVDDIAGVSASVYDAGGNGLDLPVTWTSADPLIATVDVHGRVTGMTEGTTVVTARTGGLSAGAIVNVSKKSAARITLAPDPASVQVGNTVPLTAVVYDKATRIMHVPLLWTSHSPSIATVDDSGLVTAVHVGTALISASYYGTTGYATITVTPGPVARIVISGPANRGLERGHHIQLTATAQDAHGNVIDVPLTWSSSDTYLVTVNSSGRVTGEKIGTATVTASYGEISASVTIDVFVVIAKIEIEGSSIRWLEDGHSITLIASARDAAGNKVADVPFVWTSSDIGDATVNSSGRVTGVSPGMAMITASYAGFSDSVKMIVFH